MSKLAFAFAGLLLYGTHISAAPSASNQRLLIESLDGPATPRELAAAKAFALSEPLPTHNHGNNLVYGNGHRDDELLATLFELTSDRDCLNRLIEFSDAILACRNNTNSGDLFWTGKREATWSSNTATYGGKTYQMTVVESGAILELLARCSQEIIAHKELWNQTVPVADPLHLGKTYIERARSYIRESNYTIDSFILPWSVKNMPDGAMRLYFSDAPEFKRLDGRSGNDAGKPIPWNQQFMLVRGLVRLAQAMEFLHEDSTRVALYDKISKSSVDWFISTLHKTNLNGETAYTWSYTPLDPTLHYIENSGHASSDIEGMYVCYKSGRYGISPSVMRGFANTALLLMDKSGQFTKNVDGTGGEHSLSTAWVCLAEFRPELYKIIASKSAQRTNDQRLVRILAWKQSQHTGLQQ